MFSNVSLLASAAAGQDWKLFRNEKQDGRVRYTTSDKGSDQRTEVVQHAALSVLNNPAVITVGNVKLPVWTRFGLFEISNIWMETTGKSYWVVDRGAGGQLDPARHVAGTPGSHGRRPGPQQLPRRVHLHVAGRQGEDPAPADRRDF